MVAADTEMATDHGGLRHIFHNVRAYIKVQRKYISELASKELIRTLILRTERSFYALMESGMSEYVGCIKEPEKLQRERVSMRTCQVYGHDDARITTATTTRRVRPQTFREMLEGALPLRILLRLVTLH